MKCIKHNFPIPNSDCLNCGINQRVLSKQFSYQPKPEEKLPRENNILELSDFFFEYFRKKVKYPSISATIKRKGEMWGREQMSIAKDTKRTGRIYRAGSFFFNSKRRPKDRREE